MRGGGGQEKWSSQHLLLPFVEGFCGIFFPRVQSERRSQRTFRVLLRFLPQTNTDSLPLPQKSPKEPILEEQELSFQPLQEEEEDQTEANNGDGGESSDVALSPTTLEGTERGERPEPGSLLSGGGEVSQACSQGSLQGNR